MAREFASFSTGESSETSKKSEEKKKDGSSEIAPSKPTLPKREAAPVATENAPARRSFERLFEGLVPKPPEERAERTPAESEHENEKVDKSAVSEELHHDTKDGDEVSVVHTEASSESNDEAAAELTPDEEREAVERLAEARAQEISNERAAVPPASTEAEAAQLAAQYHESVQRQVAQGMAPQEAMTAAYIETTGEPDAPELHEDIDGTTSDELETPLANEAAPTDGETTTELPHDEDDMSAEDHGAGGHGGGNGGAGNRGFGFMYGPGGTFHAGGAAMNTAVAYETASTTRREARAAAGGLLVGGIVGYLLGRRRGRIRTERQLLPVQRGLEKRVHALQDTLAIREAQVRRFVYERAATAQPIVLSRESQPANAPERRFSQPPTPVTAEAVRPRASEVASAEASKQIPSVEHMRLEDVLKMGETITIGSTSIKKVYETNLISERGLRRVVEAHLKGGDARRVLTEELIIKEISHELDPMYRDRPMERAHVSGVSGVQPVSHDEAAAAVGGQPTIQSMPTQPSAVPHVPPKQPPSGLLVANTIALVVLSALLVLLLIIWLTR